MPGASPWSSDLSQSQAAVISGGLTCKDSEPAASSEFSLISQSASHSAICCWQIGKYLLYEQDHN